MTDFDRGPVLAAVPKLVHQLERLVECDKFILDRRRCTGPTPFGGDERCHILAVLEGAIKAEGITLGRGETTLLPAACGETSFETTQAIVLDMYLP